MSRPAGDAWANLFQPFWAIPLKGNTGIKARHMFGSCITMLFALFSCLANAAAALECIFLEVPCLNAESTT